MADRLVELALSQPSNSEPVSAPVKQAEKNDDVIVRSLANTDESKVTKQLNRDYEFIQKQIETDDQFAENFLTQLEIADSEAVPKLISDTADDLKIKYLQKDNPELFNAVSAGATGLLDEALFGQASKIIGLGKKLFGSDTKSTSEQIEATAEQMRLLQKAFPKADVIGRIGSYLIPGSPAKALFAKASTKAAGLAGKQLAKAGAKGILKKSLQGAVGTIGGAAAVEGLSGTLGEGDDSFSLDRGVDDALSQVNPWTALLGAAPQLAGGAARATKRAAGKVVERITGASEEAIRASGKRLPQIRVQGSETARLNETQKLINVLESARPKSLERKAADALLNQVDDIDISKTVKALKNFKNTVDPTQDASVSLVREWGNRLEQLVKDPSKARPEVVRGWLDDAMGFSGQRFRNVDAGLAQNVIARTYGQLNSQIRKAALGTKGVGDDYIKLMNSVADKRRVVSWVKSRLGKNPENWEKTGRQFLDRMFGKNETMALRKMEQLDKTFGTNFVENAKLSNYASQLGVDKTGGADLLSRFMTGRSTLGTGLGTALGGAAGVMGAGAVGPAAAVGAAIGAAASGPAGGRAILGASDKISNFVRIAAQNERLLMKIGTSRRHPLEVREIAKQLFSEHKKNGPLSMGTMVRMFADTPYFIGLVSAMKDEQDSEQEKK